jgi:hypothetical protein
MRQELSMFLKVSPSRIRAEASHLLHHGIVMCFRISLSVGHQFLGLRCSGSLFKTFSLWKSVTLTFECLNAKDRRFDVLIFNYFEYEDCGVLQPGSLCEVGSLGLFIFLPFAFHNFFVP